MKTLWIANNTRYLLISLLLGPVMAQAACHISSSSPLLDYGQLSQQLKATAGQIALAARDMQVQVDCDEAQAIDLSFSSNENQQQFSFGRDGWLNVRIASLTLDNRSTTFQEFASRGQRQEGNQLKSGNVQPGSRIVTTDKGQHLSFILSLQPIFTHKVFAIQDDYQLANDIVIQINE